MDCKKCGKSEELHKWATEMSGAKFYACPIPDFIKYPKMENATPLSVQKIGYKGDDRGDWVVEEKAHGSNGALFYGGTIVRIGKRGGLMNLEESEKFHGSDKIREQYKHEVVQIFKDSGAKQSITIFFEFIGRNAEGKAVQLGVPYCNDLQIYVFGLRIDDKMQNRKTCEAVFDGCSFVLAPILFRGKLKDALEWSQKHNADDSTIPLLYKSTEKFPREGHVLRPYDASRTSGIKDKNPTYSEVKPRKARKERVDPKTIPEFNELMEDAQRYITVNRLNNVLSKEGPPKEQNPNRIGGLMTKDVYEDISKEWKNVEPDLLRLLKGALYSECIGFVKENMKSTKEEEEEE